MTKVGWTAVAAVAAALTAGSVLYAQGLAESAGTDPGLAGQTVLAQAPGGGAGPGRWGQMSDAERARMREQMTDRMLDESGLTAKEKAAAKNAIKAKQAARQALADELTKLQRVANKSKVTDKELRTALAAYVAAMAKYHQKVQAADQSLAKQLSLKSQVRCVSLGIIDNGLGGMGRGGAPRGTGRPGSRPGSRG